MRSKEYLRRREELLNQCIKEFIEAGFKIPDPFYRLSLERKEAEMVRLLEWVEKWKLGENAEQ